MLHASWWRPGSVRVESAPAWGRGYKNDYVVLSLLLFFFSRRMVSRSYNPLVRVAASRAVGHLRLTTARRETSWLIIIGLGRLRR